MQGEPIHGEVSSEDAHEGVTALLYPAGSLTARTLASNEFLTVTDLIFVSEDGGTYAIVAGEDDDGRRIVKGNAEAKGGVGTNFTVPRSLPKGVNVVLIAAAGQVDLVFTGYITQV